MTLDKAKKGQSIIIIAIPNRQVKDQAIRFGISEGAVVEVQEVVPAGPIVLKKGHQEIAFGRRLAKEISIQLVSREMVFDNNNNLTV